MKTVAAGRAKAVVSAGLGGWEGQPDAATVTYAFLDASGNTVGVVKLGPVTPAQRNADTGLLPVHRTTGVPSTARSVKITISAIRGSGAYNDGYADNVSLKLTT